MSAIAHVLESEGIATALIALIRLHAEKAKPPRALWVPFQLGRPLGAPGDPEFQHQVLRQALALLDRPASPPVMEDFANDEPEYAVTSGWTPPSGLEGLSVEQEVAALREPYEAARTRAKRTTVGLSGLDMDTVVTYLTRLDGDSPLDLTIKHMADVQLLKSATDDLKAFYLEAVIGEREPPSSGQLGDWFWGTAAGALIKGLRERSLDHADANRRLASWWLVPDGWSDTDHVARMRQVTSRWVDSESGTNSQ